MQAIFSDIEIEHGDHRRELGRIGETKARDHLIALGFEIVMTNFEVPVGRNSKGVEVTGEIDIIAIEQDTLCFIEVKTRRDEAFTPVLTAIDRRKQRQITRTAKVYRRMFGLYAMPHRFDAISVVIPSAAKHSIELHRSYWTEASLRKKFWINDLVNYY